MFERLVNAELIAVNFVLDYYVLQLWKDGHWFLTITNPVSVTSEGLTVLEGDVQFRNRICEQIGKKTTGISLEEGKALQIEFEDNTGITVSLLSADYDGRPEAVLINGPDNFLDVI
jgi:hypothetical protein